MDSSIDDIDLNHPFSNTNGVAANNSPHLSPISSHYSVFSRSFARRHQQSFAKSWSCQFIHGKVIPPITMTMLAKEDAELPYETFPFTKTYLPFWIVIMAHFTMFTAYNLTQNLSPSVFGSDGTIAIACIYLFFLVSSVITPSILKYKFDNNASHLIFVGSLSYTFFIASCIFGWLPLLLLGATGVGLSAGFVWVSHSSNLISIARYVSEKDLIQDIRNRLHSRLGTTPGSPSFDTNNERVEGLISLLLLPNGRVDVSKLTNEQLLRLFASTAQVTSFLNTNAWVWLNLNTVVGGFVAYFVLGGGSEDDNVNAAPLFLLFAVLALIANFIYFFAFKNSPVQMYDTLGSDKPLQIDQHEKRENKNRDLVELVPPNTSSDNNNDEAYTLPQLNRQLSPVIEHNEEDEESAIDQSNAYASDYQNPFTHNHRQHNQELNDLSHTTTIRGRDGQITTYSLQTTASSLSSTSHYSNDINNIDSPTDIVDDNVSNARDDNDDKNQNIFVAIWRSMYLMTVLMCEPVIWSSIVPWIQSSMPNNFVYSLYTANVVKSSLGIANVTLIIITLAVIDSVTALILSKFMKTFFHARFCGIFGSCCQFAMICVVLFGPTLTPENTTQAWNIAIIVAALAGIGDAVHQSGSNAALGMVAEDARIRPPAFSICQLAKSIGSIILFVSSFLISFKVVAWVLFVILIASLASQAFCWYYHLPIDVTFVLDKYDQFVNGGAPNDQDNDVNATTLDALDSSA